MVIKKKVTRNVYAENPSDQDIEEIIERGGKTTEDNRIRSKSEIRFTLRIPKTLIDAMDRNRSMRIGNISRNQWVLESIAEKLNSK